MFNRREPEIVRTSDEISDHIVAENVRGERSDFLGAANPDYSQISNDEIIVDDLAADQGSRRRFRPSQLIILGLTGVFAVGGVISFIVPSSSQKQAPVQQATPIPNPKAEITLPSGLAFTDQSKPTTEDVPSSKQASQEKEPASSASSDQGAKPDNLSAPTAKTDAPSSPAHLQPPSKATSSPQAASIADKPVSQTLPPNPIQAQAAEAKTAALTKETDRSATSANQPADKKASFTAQPAQAPKPAIKSVSSDASSTVVSNNRRAPSTTEVAHKKQNSDEVKAETTPIKVASAARKETGEETVKKLVATTPEEFGLQSILEGAITLDGAQGKSPQRLAVGDRLPSGEQIIRIDARSMTLVTDRSVIRFN